MGSRAEILAALRAAAPPASPHPGPAAPGPLPREPLVALSAAIEAVGGKLVLARDAAALRAEIAALAERVAAKRVANAVPLAGGDPRLEGTSDPHGLEGIDLAVLPGEFAVVENGAVWVDTRPLGRLRGAFVVAQHLALVVPAAEVVSDMHAAYERLSFEAFLGLGLFISGPSKTADIEQALVIGAHGARSCTVIAVG